jgi:hypothetical protein
MAEIRHYYKFPENLFLGSDQRKQMLRTMIEKSPAKGREGF